MMTAFRAFPSLPSMSLPSAVAFHVLAFTPFALPPVDGRQPFGSLESEAEAEKDRAGGGEPGVGRKAGSRWCEPVGRKGGGEASEGGVCGEVSWWGRLVVPRTGWSRCGLEQVWRHVLVTFVC